MLSDFLSILFPENCLNCNQSLISSEDYLCLSCKLDLPVTNDHLFHENDLLRKFTFNQRVKSASSFLFFNKGGIAQKLLYQLKYNGKGDIGVKLGEWYGANLVEHVLPDLIIPVPIHKSKLRSRGYNQSTRIAEGLVELFKHSKIEETLVKRTKKTQTQTRKSRVERWHNMENVYSQITKDLSGISVLIVDDVITTGATVGMLCDRLIEANVDAIHILSIARGK